MSVSDELQKLEQLRQSGAIDEREFAQAKARILDSTSSNAVWIDSGDVEAETRKWAMILHFSMLAGFVVPFGGLICPILVWQLKKSELPDIDEHGKNAVNWIISCVIYGIVCFLLVFVMIGIPLLIGLGILGIVFPIIAGIKANAGVIWRYPMTIQFLT